MKKIFPGIILVVLIGAVGLFVFMRPRQKQMERHAQPGPVAESKLAAETKPVSEEPPMLEEKPEAEPKREQPEVPPAPLRIRFDATTPPVLQKPVPVSLVVETNPEIWPQGIIEDCQLEFLLRLPPGVKLESEGWNPVELPPQEKNDPSGPWSLFERKQPINIPAGVPPAVLAKETVNLSVVEPGSNWILTVRARLVSGTQSWQAFGLVLATLDGDTAKFHAQPLMPALTQKFLSTKEERAKTN